MKIFRLSTLFVGLCFVFGCENDIIEAPQFSNKITISIDEVKKNKFLINTVKSGISEPYGKEIQQYGHCWDTLPNPDIYDHNTSFGVTNRKVSFTSSIQHLAPLKDYYIRGYFKIDDHIVYSNQMKFNSNFEIPILYIDPITMFDENLIIKGGITYDGGRPIENKGIIWGLNPQHGLKDKVIERGKGSDSFNDTITRLWSNTDYYIRTFATNDIGTGYSKAILFRNRPDGTFGTFVDCRDSTIYNWINIGSQTWMSENLKYQPLFGDDNIVSVKVNDSYEFFYGLKFLNEHDDPCPCGWRMPTHEDWTKLFEFEGETGYGSTLRTRYSWVSDGTNLTGFSAVALGIVNKKFFYVDSSDKYAIFWSSTPPNYLVQINESEMYFHTRSAYVDNGFKFSIRCIKEN